MDKDDIAAIQLLKSQLLELKKTKLAMDKVSGAKVEQFRNDTKKTCSNVGNALMEVTDYINNIQTLVKELAAEVKLFTEAIQAKIRNLINSLTVLQPVVTTNWKVADSNVARLEEILALEKLAKEVINARLNELAIETEIALEKSKSAIGLSQNDINNLLGCLESWENQEELSHKDKIEQRQREEGERKRQKEEEERRQKEAEEERKRKEEERRQREEEERKRAKEEEERRLKEAEEERKRKEEERRQREEEERKQAEEAERRLKEAEEERRRQEEERRRKLEEEEKRRLQKEEEERQCKERERLDPNNWPWQRYPREESLEVDGDRSYHKGVCCYISAPVGNVNYDDVICNASDEVDDVIEHIAAGDKVAGSLINIRSTKGEIKTEVPLRIQVPHVPIQDPQEELVFIVSINGQWSTQFPIKSKKPSSSKQDIASSCLSVDSFESLNVMAVSRRKGEIIIVDPPGKLYQLAHDKNVTVVLPRETYSSRTEMRVTVRAVDLKNLGAHDKNFIKMKCDILSAGPLFTIQCERIPMKSFELDIAQRDSKRKGRLYYVARSKDGKWCSAPTGSKGIHDDVISVSFPAGSKDYSFLEIEMSTTAREEDAFKAAEAIFSLLTKTIVNVIIRQRSDDATVGIVHVVRHDNLQQRLKELDGLGYDLGEACSSEFAMQDGDRIIATMSGNVCFAPGVVEPIMVTFSALMDRARLNVKFAVKDLYTQRDYPSFMGRLKGQVVPKQDSRDPGDGLMVEIPVHLPKIKPSTAISYIPIKFPYYMSALTIILADRLTNTPGLNWKEVIDKLDTPKNIGKLQRRAKGKCNEGSEEAFCRMVLLDWMKEQPRNMDKLKPISDALLQSNFKSLHTEIKEFVDYYKASLSDDMLRDVARRLTGSQASIGTALGFTLSEVKDITSSGSEDEQRFLLLAEWRETERAVKCSLKAADEMKKLLSSCM